MIIYIITFTIASVIAVVSKPMLIKSNSVKKKYINTIYVSFLLIGLLIGLRDSFGIDDQMYVTLFYEAVKTGKGYRSIEYSYILICKIISLFGLNYQAVFLFYAILGSLLIGKAFCQITEKEDYVLVFALFWALLFTNMMTAVRQFLAIGLLLNGFLAFKNKKRISAVVYFTLSFFIHYASIAGILLYFLGLLVKKIDYKKKIIILIFLYIMQYIPVAKYITDLVSQIPFIQGNYYIKYYLTSGAKSIFTDPLGINESIIFMLTLLVMWTLNKNNWKQLNRIQADTIVLDFEQIETLCFIYWGAMMFLNQFGFLRRIVWVFFIFAAVYVVKGIKVFNRRDKLWVKLFFFTFFLAIFIYTIVIYSEPIIPYRANFDLLLK